MKKTFKSSSPSEQSVIFFYHQVEIKYLKSSIVFHFCIHSLLHLRQKEKEKKDNKWMNTGPCIQQEKKEGNKKTCFVNTNENICYWKIVIGFCCCYFFHLFIWSRDWSESWHPMRKRKFLLHLLFSDQNKFSLLNFWLRLSNCHSAKKNVGICKSSQMRILLLEKIYWPIAQSNYRKDKNKKRGREWPIFKKIFK